MGTSSTAKVSIPHSSFEDELYCFHSAEEDATKWKKCSINKKKK